MKKIIVYLVAPLLVFGLLLSPVLASTDNITPSVPASLTATVVSSSQINLDWIASTDNVAIAGYIVFRNDFPVAFRTADAFVDTGLSANTQYTYTVKAVDTSFNLSDASLAVDATTLAKDEVMPSAPLNLTITVISSRQIDLNWTAATDNIGVVGYQIFRNGVLIDTSDDLMFSSTHLAATTKYSFAVKAFDAAGNISAESNLVVATTLPPNYKNRGEGRDDWDEQEARLESEVQADANVQIEEDDTAENADEDESEAQADVNAGIGASISSYISGFFDRDDD